jgi:hypothetical protein
MRASAALLVVIALAACHGPSSSVTDTPDARESPQASAQPALLAAQPTAPASAATALGVEAGPAPAPFRADEELSPDTLAREATGYTLSAAFRPADVMAPPHTPEVNTIGIDAARKATELRVAIDLSPTRMRLVLAGRGFVLPQDTEIRARSDRYGHVVVWPGAVSYRPLSPGAMRALLGERRFDVAPITPAEIALRDDTGRRIGIRTRRAEVTTRAAHASFEIGRLEGAGEGGTLLCRLMLDLMNAPPGTPVCAFDELPVRVELRWTTRGSLVFELTGYLRRTDVALSALVVPPATASFAASPFPATGMSPVLSTQELAGLRFSDVEVPPSVPPAPQLVNANSTLELRVLYLDGVPVAWAAPGARGELPGLHRGRYVAQWRTFMGDAVDNAFTLVVPGVAQVGASPDAGR